MGREVRRVPSNWQHPKNDSDSHQPMYDESFREAAISWKAEFLEWEAGKQFDYFKPEKHPDDFQFWEWGGGPPDRGCYRPDWSEGLRTHYQMYETTTEGTPISPVMESPETLAQWLVDNNASASASQTATYKAWLAVCYGGYAPSAVGVAGKLMSGVEGMNIKPLKGD